MKFIRAMAVFGPTHFAVWWLTYGTLLMFDFDVLGPTQSPTILNIVHHLNHALLFPFLIGPMRPVMRHMPIVIGVAFASFIWAGGLCVGIRACQTVRHVYKELSTGAPNSRDAKN